MTLSHDFVLSSLALFHHSECLYGGQPAVITCIDQNVHMPVGVMLMRDSQCHVVCRRCVLGVVLSAVVTFTSASVRLYFRDLCDNSLLDGSHNLGTAGFRFFRWLGFPEQFL